MRQSAVLALGLLGLLLAAGPAGAQTAPPATPAATGDVAGLVDIGGGREMYLECRGAGGPTVVLESGYPNNADVWDAVALDPASGKTAVLPGVAAFTSVVAYDRPGTILDFDLRSRSDLVPMPRSAIDVVTDLHMLLEIARVPGPYVLVGHSLGGFFARLYASIWPDEVAGLVLVDAWYEGLREALSPEDWAAYVRQGVTVPPSLVADFPDLERVNFDAVADAMVQPARDHPLRDIPLYVITAGLPFDVTEEDLGFSPDAWQDAWATAQDQLASLLPDARHVIAEESGHGVHVEQPELVIEAVRQVVEAVRDPSTWATPAASSSPAA